MYHKKFLIIALLLVLALFSRAQIPKFKSNTSENEKLLSPIYKSLSNQYDLIIGFTAECYWWSDRKPYRLLAFKNGIWLKGYFYSKRRKNHSWTNPTIKLKEINKDSANSILNYLSDAGFFVLNRDTLNIDRRKINDKQDEVFSISDAVNYRFEILTKNTFTIIESYQPDYFLEKLPEFKSREIFIKYRDWFIEKYKNL